jgi:hypothetical protein
MIKTVFILGAGASRTAGGPLMYDFIEKAQQVQQANKAGWAGPHFKSVFEARRKFQAAYAKSNLDIDNIESLFATFEIARLIGHPSNMSEEDTRLLPRELRFLIMRTIEQSIKYPIYDDDPVVRVPAPYEAFTELLLGIEESPELSSVAVISFNYDLLLEYAFTVRGIQIDYGLGPAPKRDAIPVYKLHGSLNWSFNQAGGQIETRPTQKLPAKSYLRRIRNYSERPLRRPIDTMELLHGPDEWGNKPIPEPLIVPPTWSKGQYQEMLRSVWCNASKALSTAENIFVIGYSLPLSDQFFRAFFALSTISDSIIERFWVFDPADIATRYQSLVGAAISNRDKFKYQGAVFSDAVVYLAKALDFDEESIRTLLSRG